MSLFARQKKRDLFGYPDASGLIPARVPRKTGSVTVTNDTALRHSAVWACLRLRSNLISTLPLDVFRRVGDIQVEMSKAPVLVAPGGERWDYIDWMHATQFDLDRTGNTVGLVTEKNSLGLPARIDLQAIGDCAYVEKVGREPKWRIGAKEYDLGKVWHERQYPVAGHPVGLSPVAYAAWSIGQYSSAQEFALNWYSTGGVPKATYRNTQESIVNEDIATGIKLRFKRAAADNDVVVTGKDWEYRPVEMAAVGMEWLEAQKFGIGDIARFFDCPGDLIDAAVQGSNITYANVTQRNLQYLITSLGPAIVRRERALSKLLPAPRYVKLNTAALLRMDDKTQAEVFKLATDGRWMVPSEVRELLNREPLTEAQLAEFDRVYGAPRVTPTAASATPA